MSEIQLIIENVLDDCNYNINNIENIHKVKDNVKNKYISNLNQNYPDKNALQSWRIKSGEFLEIFVVKYLNNSMDNNIFNINREKNLPSNIINQLKLNFNNKTKLPDIDVVVYSENNPIAILSCKTTPRERVSQTLFWKYAIDDKLTNPPKFYFITMDEDKELNKDRKWRSIMVDTIDCCYVLNENSYEYSDSFKQFQNIKDDIKNV